jgi:hypothetical protein
MFQSYIHFSVHIMFPTHICILHVISRNNASCEAAVSRRPTTTKCSSVLLLGLSTLLTCRLTYPYTHTNKQTNKQMCSSYFYPCIYSIPIHVFPQFVILKVSKCLILMTLFLSLVRQSAVVCKFIYVLVTQHNPADDIPATVLLLCLTI